MGLSTSLSNVVYANETNAVSNNDTASNSKIWDIHITNIQTKDILETEEKVTLYDGDTQLVNHVDIPSLGSKYLLVEVSVEKLKTDSSIFNISDATVEIENETYNQIDNGFLYNHEMSHFTKNDIRMGNNSGYIIFEIPSNSGIESAKININGEEFNLEISEVDNIIETNISVTENIIDMQWEREKEILEDYNLGKYSPENPYVILDPYNWAPLSALVMFETQSLASVSVKVVGKDEYSHIEKNFNDYNTFHQIPILGLYADYENTVEITVEYSNGNVEKHTIFITTEPLANDSNLIDVKVITSNPELMEEGLTFLTPGSPGKYLSAVDANGEIRWHLYCLTHQLQKRISNGNFIVGPKNRLDFYELDLLGKVHAQYRDPVKLHHDIIELPNGNFLATSYYNDYYDQDRILELDRVTGEIVNDIDVKNILNKDRRNSNNDSDWLHMNALWYDETDESLIVSGYKQGVFKITYPEGKLVWITTLPVELEGIENEYLTPLGDFEPPYGQHAPMIMSDQDGNPDTLDIMLYDNNVDGRDYSKMVQYRINEKDMTIEEVWSYGEERGYDYYTSRIGDADYFESGNVIGTFGDRNSIASEASNQFTIGTIIEVNKYTDEVIYEIDVKFNDKSGVYRSERLPVYPETWNFQLYTTKGEVKARNNHETMQTNVQFEEIELPEVISSRGSVSTNFNDTFSDLDISGYQMMEGVDSSKYEMSLIFHSDTMTKAVPLEITENSTRGKAANEAYKDDINYDFSSFNIAIPYEQLEAELPKDTYTIYTMIEADGKVECRETVHYFSTSTWSLVQEKDVIQEHNDMATQLLKEYESKNYTIEEPFVKINPYGNAPLSAVTLFETEKPAQITVEVSGLRGGETLTNTYKDYATAHQIPIYGLYSGEETDVILTATYEDGTSETNTLKLTGDALPSNFVPMNVTYSEPSEMYHGLTFYMRQDRNTYFNALDSNGDVRFMLSDNSIGMASGMEVLENGNIIVVSEKTTGTQYYKDSFYELDLTGRIYSEYLLEGVHHDITEHSNGNFLALGNDINGDVVEDTLYEIERATGNIVKIWDMDDYLPLDAFDENGNRISSEVYDSNAHDWIHLNSVDYNEKTNEILLSARNHDLVFSMDYSTGKINYIIGDPNTPLTKEQETKLLTPIGDDFEWSYGHHNAQFLDNGDILLFDNGSYRSKDLETQVGASEDGYSRGVIYRIDQENMTIEQVWQFGKELGSSHLATYLSGIQYLDDNHFFINFGGQVFDENGNPSYLNADAVNGHSASIQYEVKDGKIVYASNFEIAGVSGNMYRAERLNPYYNTEQLDISKIGYRYGSLPVRNLLEKANFEESKNVLEILSSSIVDNSVQLVINLNFAEAPESENIVLYAIGEKETYSLDLGSSSKSISKYINIEEFPDDNYEFYVKAGDSTADLLTTWNK